MDSNVSLQEQARRAREAQRILVGADPTRVSEAVRGMASLLREREQLIANANEHDVRMAEADGIAPRLAARLAFPSGRIRRRADVLDEIARLSSPLNGSDGERELANGLRARRQRCAIGVIAVIYEARPHVTLNAGALCLKSGNAVLLKGGGEVTKTNLILAMLWHEALCAAGLPEHAVQVVTAPGVEVARELLGLREHIDLIIPRGGRALIEAVTKHSHIPVIKHDAGNCHVYVDSGADAEQALEVCLDGKLLMPEVCNATESIVVASDSAGAVVPRLVQTMREHGVTVRGCPRTLELAPSAEAATTEDWSTEYLDLMVSVRVVEDLNQAIEHINRYGSGHTDAIVSPSRPNVERFAREVDSAVVLANASTMFCDGHTLGMGAEIGISTDRLHARGPMGMEELTTYKWVIEGDGHTMSESRWAS